MTKKCVLPAQLLFSSGADSQQQVFLIDEGSTDGHFQALQFPTLVNTFSRGCFPDALGLQQVSCAKVQVNGVCWVTIVLSFTE